MGLSTLILLSGVALFALASLAVVVADLDGGGLDPPGLRFMTGLVFYAASCCVWVGGCALISGY